MIGATTSELIAQGFLCPARCYVPARSLDLHGVRVRRGDYLAADLARVVDGAAITGDAVAQYRLRADHAPAIAFCVTVDHAQHVAEAFRGAGYRAASVHGGTPIIERDALIAGLGDGRVEVLTSCDVIREGLDVPGVACVILLRPTQSLVLHRQQIGRGMRTAPGKTSLVVNDHVGNVIVHGLPEEPVAWSLAGVDKRPGPASTSVWRCDACGAANPNGTRQCQACGAQRPVGVGRVVSVAPGELAEITAARRAAILHLPYRAIVRGCFSEAELRAYAKAHGYHPGWVRHRLREQRAVEP